VLPLEKTEGLEGLIPGHTVKGSDRRLRGALRFSAKSIASLLLGGLRRLRSFLGTRGLGGIGVRGAGLWAIAATDEPGHQDGEKTRSSWCACDELLEQLVSD